jgi:hypothetical protein
MPPALIPALTNGGFVYETFMTRENYGLWAGDFAVVEAVPWDWGSR